jgi:hypothetical protein
MTKRTCVQAFGDDSEPITVARIGPDGIANNEAVVLRQGDDIIVFEPRRWAMIKAVIDMEVNGE